MAQKAEQRTGIAQSLQHPRLADIQAAQPPVKTLKGTGNYNQYSKYILSNVRKR